MEAAIPLWRELESRAGETILTLCGNLFFAQPGNALLAQSLQAIEAAQSPYERLISAEVTARWPVLRLLTT